MIFKVLLNYNGLRYLLLQWETVECPKWFQRGFYITSGFYKALLSVSQNQHEADRNLWISNISICQFWKKKLLERIFKTVSVLSLLLCWLNHIALCQDCVILLNMRNYVKYCLKNYLGSISFILLFSEKARNLITLQV